MELKIDEEQMNALVSKAVFEMIPPEAREQLLQRAVFDLITGSSKSAYGNKTKLQELFEQAVFTTARKLIEEHLTNSPVFEEKIRELFIECINRAFTGDNRDKLVNKLTNALSEGLFEGKRY